MTKFAGSKIAAALGSTLLLVVLWGVIAAVGWSGTNSEEVPGLAAAAQPPPASQPQVIIRRIHVVRRLSADGSVTPPPGVGTTPVLEPAPAAPPPPAVSQPSVPAQCEKKGVPVACSRGS